MNHEAPISLKEKYFNIEIHNIGRADQIDLICGILSKLLLDLGKKMTDADLEYLQREMSQYIPFKYKFWKVSDLVAAIENGKIGNYGSSYSINVATIQSWLYQHHNKEVNPRIIRDRESEQQRLRNTTSAMLTGANWHGENADALLWRLKLIDGLKSKRHDYAKKQPEYEAKKSQIFAIPYSQIVTACKNGTTGELLNQYGLSNL